MSNDLCMQALHTFSPPGSVIIFPAWFSVRLHMQHIAFREETRYPGFYYRADFPGIDDKKWKCFVNSKYDPKTGETKVFKRTYYKLIPDAE